MYPLTLKSSIIRIISSAIGICDYKNDKMYKELISKIDRTTGFSKKRNYTHPNLQLVDNEHSFKLKKDHWTTIAEILSLEELHKELGQAPQEAIIFHMERQNDFANWVRDIVGDWWLAENLKDIQLSYPDQTKAELIKAIGQRIKLLKFNGQ